MLNEVLENIGFSAKEISVYSALVELGPQPVSVIARKAKLNRSTAYVVLESLLKRGVISKFTRSDIQHFAATNPESLLDYVDRAKQNLERQHETIKDILPHIKAMSNPYTLKPRVRYFEGPEGVKQTMEDTLTAKSEILCYSALDKWLAGPLERYIRDYGVRRINEKKITLKSLVYDTPIARKYLDKDYPRKLSKMRWIPKDLVIVDNEINIYDDKVVIVSLSPEEMFGVIIESKAIAETQKQIFEMAWRSAVPSE